MNWQYEPAWGAHDTRSGKIPITMQAQVLVPNYISILDASQNTGRVGKEKTDEYFYYIPCRHKLLKHSLQNDSLFPIQKNYNSSKTTVASHILQVCS